MTPYSLNIVQKAVIHKSFDPGSQRAWIGSPEKMEREGNPQMNSNESRV